MNWREGKLSNEEAHPTPCGCLSTTSWVLPLGTNWCNRERGVRRKWGGEEQRVGKLLVPPSQPCRAKPVESSRSRGEDVRRGAAAL